MASGSRRGGHGKMDGNRRGLAVLDAFGQNAQRQNFGARHGLDRSRAVGHYARKLRHFSQPTTVFFAFNFEGEFHKPECTPGAWRAPRARGKLSE